MGVKWKTDKNDLTAMERSIKALNNREIKVGYIGPKGEEQAWLAHIHEYGCRIQVTPKMRAWLHRNGLHLKPTTTEIIIPERSFLRTGFDLNHEKVIKVNEDALAACLVDGKVDKFLESVALMLRDKIYDYAVDLKDPPKHPFSLERNPSKTNPLVISGDMLGALSYEVN